MINPHANIKSSKFRLKFPYTQEIVDHLYFISREKKYAKIDDGKLFCTVFTLLGNVLLLLKTF